MTNTLPKLCLYARCMRWYFTLLLLLAGAVSHAQVQEMKAGITGDLPLWAQMMYSENPDVNKVIAAFEAWYATHPFIKNQHTQYFKRWTREMQRNPYVTPPGKPLSRYDKDQTARYLQRTNAARQMKAADAAGVAAWQPLGPINFDRDAAGLSYAAGAAHVYTVEQSLSNTSVVYAGTANAGLYKSTDKGLNWTALTDNMLVTSIVAIEIDQLDHNIVYFGGGGKIYKSTNGGTSFSLTGDATFNNTTYQVNDIVSRPGFRNTLFLATNKGLYRTTDGGTSYTQISAGDYLEVEFKPGDNNTVYAVRVNGTKTEFYKSTDGGSTFTLKTSGWPAPAAGEEQKRTEISVSAANPAIVYALATGAANGGSGLYGVYVSTNSGESWTFKCCGTGPGGAPSPTNKNLMGWDDQGQDDGGQYYYDLAMDVNPANASQLQVGAVNRWVSSDSGATFTCPAKWSHSNKVNYVHADIHDIRFYGSDLWVACDGGIFYSSDNGANFSVRMKGIMGTDFWGFGLGFWEGSQVMIGGTYHNGTLLKDNSTYNDGWLSTDGGDGIFGAVAYSNDRIAYSDYGKKRLTGSRTSAPVGLPNGKLPNRSYITGRSSELIYDAQVYNTIYLGEGTQLWKSTDGSENYTSVYNFGETVGHIAVGYKRPQLMYAATLGTTRKLWRSSNSGAAWTEITPSGISSGSLPYNVVVSSSNPAHIWIARVDGTADGQKVYKSVDSGATWVNLSTATLNGEQITCLVYQRGTNGGVYLGTRRAVYYRNNAMADWVIYNQGLPAQTFSTRLYIDYKDTKLINATSRSVYATALYEKSMPEALIAVEDSTISTSDTARFYNHSALHNNSVTYAWTFPGGTPATSTVRNPKVKYAQPGQYNVKLKVTNADGTDSIFNTAFITVGNSGTVTPIESGAIYELKPACAPTRNLQAHLGGAADGTNINIATDNNSNYQRWKVTSVGNGYYRLQPQHTTGKSMDVEAGGTTAGTNVLMWTDNTGTNQQWKITDVGGGYHKLQPGNAPALSLDVADGANADNANVQIYTDNNSNAQKWRFELIAGNTCATGGAIPAKTQWSIRYFSSEEATGEGTGNGKAIHAIDGNTATFWHSEWSAATPSHPHEIQINLGTCATVGAVGYLPRQDAGTNGTITGYEVYTSSDGVNWGNVASSGTWPASGKTERLAPFIGRNAQYIRLRSTGAASGSQFASAAEINVYASAPMVTDTIHTVEGQVTSTGVYKLYPNPAQAFVTIQLPESPSAAVRYRIYDMQGQQRQFGWLFNNINQVGITTLPPGMYLISIGEGTARKTLRFIVQ